MTTDSCQQFRHLLEAYCDGQLEPSAFLSVEDHLESCEVCRERVAFQRAIVGSLKREVQTALPQDARARLMAALAAEAEADEAFARASSPGERALDIADPVQVKPFRAARSWGVRSAVPLTAAAALALLWGASAQGPLTANATRASISGAARAAASSQEFLDELVSEHVRPLPPDRTDPQEVREFVERHVGVPVKPRVKAPDTRLVGGRVMPMHHERAAMLQYEIGSGADAKRVSVLVYDPRRIQVGNAELAPRTVGTAEVHVGRARGYSVAITQRDGIGYAIASDMDAERSAQFVNYVAE